MYFQVFWTNQFIHEYKLNEWGGLSKWNESSKSNKSNEQKKKLNESGGSEEK